MRFRLGLILAIVVVLAFSMEASAKLAPGDYIDIKSHWAEPEIQTAYNLGIMQGTAVTAQGFKVFTPEGKVNRAQLASVLVRTFKLDFGDIRFFKQPEATDYFSDVDNQAWYAEDAIICAINKIFISTGDRSFSPDTSVTRLEVAHAVQHSFEAKAITVPMIMVMPNYADMLSRSQEAINAMVFVSNTGIMKGDGKLFRPDDTITRAELAAVVTRCHRLIELNQQ
ncbi:MAG: S-layer homology domain-containing protein [Methylocystaceae bacterium]